MTEGHKEFVDKEFSGAPTPKSFLLAVLTKYGILGVVVMFLGWQWTVKDTQQQQTTAQVIGLVERCTAAISQSSEIQRQTLEVNRQSLEVNRQVMSRIEWIK